MNNTRVMRESVSQKLNLLAGVASVYDSHRDAFQFTSSWEFGDVLSLMLSDIADQIYPEGKPSLSSKAERERAA